MSVFLFYGEEKVLRFQHPNLYEISKSLPLEKAFAAVIIANVVIAGLLVVILGFRVGEIALYPDVLYQY